MVRRHAPLLVLTAYEARTGREDELRTALESLIEPSYDIPGCLTFEVYADPNRPQHMLTLERWTDEHALIAQRATPQARHVAGAMPRLVARQPICELPA